VGDDQVTVDGAADTFIATGNNRESAKITGVIIERNDDRDLAILDIPSLNSLPMQEPSSPHAAQKTIRAFVIAMEMDRACSSQSTDFDGGIRQWKYTKIEVSHLLSDYDSLLTKVKINLNIFLHCLRCS
jgi:hypothetical protein